MSLPLAVITGARGQLGQALVATAPEDWRAAGFGRRELDLTRPDQLRAVLGRERPALVINAAAYTRVDDAEREPEAARAVNARGAGDLAAAAHAVGARVIHVSTDFVFDGAAARPWRVEDEPRTRGAYAASKLEGERAVAAATRGEALVVRTAWLHSAVGHNFPHLMLRLMRERDTVAVVSDRVGSPTWASSMARALWAAAARPALRGVLHWVDAGVASRYDFAVAVQEEALALGLLARPVRLVPVGAEEFPEAAPRPAYAVLDTRSSARALGLEPEHWRVNLRRMLAELRTRSGIAG
ncbi:MAG TPA: dTDP-4-dehydrorhamnose reductase [Gemmatimonadales bacterium]|jgi:dTDP-4-dehydrorhamnose reductase|nr:dTDP-4-dehydrorhamnose reductase [Gemmatimonadales bacterium]